MCTWGVHKTVPKIGRFWVNFWQDKNSTLYGSSAQGTGRSNFEKFDDVDYSRTFKFESSGVCFILATTNSNLSFCQGLINPQIQAKSVAPRMGKFKAYCLCWQNIGEYGSRPSFLVRVLDKIKADCSWGQSIGDWSESYCDQSKYPGKTINFFRQSLVLNISHTRWQSLAEPANFVLQYWNLNFNQEQVWVSRIASGHASLCYVPSNKRMIRNIAELMPVWCTFRQYY